MLNIFDQLERMRKELEGIAKEISEYDKGDKANYYLQELWKHLLLVGVGIKKAEAAATGYHNHIRKADAEKMRGEKK